MIDLADRVRETTTTTGTGTYNLAGAATGFQTFVAGVGDGGEAPYCCTDGTDWEVGVGTVTDAAPDTLSRDTIIASSNGGAAVNWGSGSKDIFLTASAAIVPHWGETFEPSGAATLDIDISGCEAVEIVGSLTPATDDAVLHGLVSNDGGSTFETGAAYYQYAWDYRSSSGANGTETSSGDSKMVLSRSIGTDAPEGVGFKLTIICPAESAIPTKVTGGVVGGSSASTTVTLFGGASVAGAEINNAFRFLFSSGNIESGRVTVYRYPAP